MGSSLSQICNRPLKKAHLLRCARPPRSDVPPKYAYARCFLTRLASGTFLTGLRTGLFNTPFKLLSLAWRISLALFFLAQTGCITYPAVSSGVVNLDKLQEIKKGLVAIRGLKFIDEVPITVKKKDEIRKYLEASLLREYGEERLKNISLAYAKLGLFPRRFDLRKSLLDFYNSQVVAFYDPKEKKLILPEDLGGGNLLGAVQFPAQRDILGEMVLAHELTHALQDQHFSLGERLGPSNNDDKSLAFRAVAEGDATLSGFGYLFGGLGDKSLVHVNQAVQGSTREARATLSDVPKALVEQLLFQYYGGVSFVSRLLEEKGWLGVNRLYAFPPLSTEQILHPEKYFDLPDPPTGIDFKDLSSLFPSGWEEIEDNVLGELMVQVLFTEFLSEKEGKAVANGWDGDRFVAFRRGDEVSFIWATVWDSSSDAEEFFKKYQEILSKRYGGSGAASSHAYIEQRDQQVVIVEGLERAHVEDHVKKIWLGISLSSLTPGQSETQQESDGAQSRVDF
ncbi:MAG: hypothetical protein O7B35_13340 [Deltaproteobacteria bacterium]|nr:hypothetical protein [Deltaproteobacteria bacterium]